VRLKRDAKAKGGFFVEDEPSLAFVVRIRGINDMHPKSRKILQLLRLKQIHNGVFVKVRPLAGRHVVGRMLVRSRCADWFPQRVFSPRCSEGNVQTWLFRDAYPRHSSPSKSERHTGGYPGGLPLNLPAAQGEQQAYCLYFTRTQVPFNNTLVVPAGDNAERSGHCHLQVNKATVNMMRVVEPYIAWGYPNLKTVQELIYKRGYGKVNKDRIPLTDNAVVEKVRSRALQRLRLRTGIRLCACSYRASHTCSLLTASAGAASCCNGRSVSHRNRKIVADSVESAEGSPNRQLPSHFLREVSDACGLRSCRCPCGGHRATRPLSLNCTPAAPRCWASTASSAWRT